MPEDKKELTITARRDAYKGFPMLVLSSGPNERYPFSFGLQKARRIVACMKDIEAFVADEGPKEDARKARVAESKKPAAINEAVPAQEAR